MRIASRGHGTDVTTEARLYLYSGGVCWPDGATVGEGASATCLSHREAIHARLKIDGGD